MDVKAEPDQQGWGKRLLWSVLRLLPGWLISMLVHVAVLVTLALWTLPPKSLESLTQLVVAPGPEAKVEDVEVPDQQPVKPTEVVQAGDALTLDPSPSGEKVEVRAPEEVTGGAAGAVGVQLGDAGLAMAPTNDLLASLGTFSGDAFSGRGAGKARLVAEGGGSEGSERAVAAGLKWLAQHQMSDGGWNFNHVVSSSCHGQCRNPGSMGPARIAATGLALLPFLGAGNTQKEGKYKAQVKAGLYFLVSHMRVGPEGGSLLEDGGNMYSHGIASICLCEAYAMTHDKSLVGPAQQAVNFICYAQDPVGGGWRYRPRMAGDTSVVGWQLMALKSAHMAYLPVPVLTFKQASRFLDTVQSNHGANYGYTTAGDGPATTAIGLLCRMYLGWRHDNPSLERGVQWLSLQGPSRGDMYYDYYATQVMHHWEGDPWKKWNAVMRDQLVNSQATRGHETGSWYMDDDHFNPYGGRLYCTAMATMTLEVYYRHLPIYRKQSTQDQFPLD